MAGKEVHPSNNKSGGDTLYLDDLNEHSGGPITVMVCRKWDVNNINGRYMSTDFIVSDQKGNVIHCTARNSIAHLFVDKLEEGGLYSLRGFSVQPNRDEYRILKDSAYMVEFQGCTSVKKADGDIDAFVRYPFAFVALEDLTPTDKKHFVDVIGYVTCLGSISKKSNGAQTLDFNLSNERGRHVRITLWGTLGDQLLEKKRLSNEPYVVVLTSMSAKYYAGHLCLSSSSSTLIFDDPEIPAVQEFKQTISNLELREANIPVLQVIPSVPNIAELLRRARQNKNEAVAFTGEVEITNVRTKNSWYNFTCTSGKCRKGVSRRSGNFWCNACDTSVAYPRPRFRLQIDVKDETDTTVIVFFNETAEKLLKTTAKALLEAQDAQEDTDEVSSLPRVIENLVGRRHVFEVKSTTYYQYGDYESFNCARVIDPELKKQTLQLDKKGNLESASALAASASTTPVKKAPSISTPAKKTEKKTTKHRAHDQNTDTSDEESMQGNAGNPPPKKARRYIVRSDSESETLEDAKKGDNITVAGETTAVNPDCDAAA